MRKKKNLFERFSNWATHATGSSAAFIIATSTVIIWAVSGPIFNYSETWQLVIITGTTIVTISHSKIPKQGFQSNPPETQ